jgi:hypothetical protein
MGVSGQLLASGTLPPGEEPQYHWLGNGASQSQSGYWRREKALASAGNPTPIPLSSSLYRSHCTDWDIPVPSTEITMRNIDPFCLCTEGCGCHCGSVKIYRDWRTEHSDTSRGTGTNFLGSYTVHEERDRTPLVELSSQTVWMTCPTKIFIISYRQASF